MPEKQEIRISSSITIPILIIDNENNIIDVNSSAKREFGEIEGKNFCEVFNRKTLPDNFVVFFNKKHYECIKIPVNRNNFAIFFIKESIFRDLANSLSVGVFLIWEDKIKYANKKFAKILGFNVNEIVDREITDFVHPEDKGVIKECLKDFKEKSFLIRALREDGRERILKIFISKLFYRNGEIFAGTAMDVTEREEYKNRLEEYKRFFEKAQDLFFILDKKGKFIEINPKFAEIMGYSLKEIIGKNSKELVHPDDLERLRRFFRQALNGEIVRDEFRALTKDGRVLWFDVVEWPIFSGEEVTKIEGILREISKRKELEEKYKILFYQSPIAITLADKGKFVEVNREFEKLSGYKRDEIIGRCFLDFVAEEDRERVANYYKNRLEGKKAPTRYIYKLLRKDGKIRFVESKVLKLPDNKTLTCRIDITERVRYEKLLETMYRINRAIFLEKDVEILLKKVVNEIGGWCDFAIASCDSVIIAHGIDAERAKEIVKFSKCFEWALKNKKSMIITSGKHPEVCKYYCDHKDLNTYVFPIIRKDRIFGALIISSKDSLSMKEVEMIGTVINDLSLALDSIELERARMDAVKQIEKNIEQIATIVDKIRNPLAEIIGFAELEEDFKHRDKIIGAAYKIERVLRELDKGWIASEEIREFLSKLRDSEKRA